MSKALIFAGAAVLAGSSVASGSDYKATSGAAERENVAEREDVLEQENTAERESVAEQKSGEEGVFQVILPTDTEHVFDFIMDPQGLIYGTGAAAYGGRLFEEGATLFFKRGDDTAAVDYSSSSDTLTIVNMGEGAVEVTLTACVVWDSVGSITMTGDREFTDDVSPGLYLALTDGEQTIAVDCVDGATINRVIDDSYSFWLTGAVNSKGDWSQLGNIAPRVTVTWKVGPVEEEYNIEEHGDEEVGTPSDAR